MGMYTFISEGERACWSSVEDKDINGLLQEVREKFGYEHVISQRVIEIKRFFRKPTKKVLYSIYVGKGVEVQCINFCQEHSWSINSSVTKSYIITYILGMLTGYAYATQSKDKLLQP